jgi:hypothetical protein
VKKVRISFTLVLFVLALSVATFGQKATRIKFARGAVSSTVTGTLNGYKDAKLYVIRVSPGQRLTTEQIIFRHGGKPVTIFVEDPTGGGVGDSDASCNNRRDITPTVAGDYRIRIVECQKADAWRGNFKFKVTVR